MNAKVDVAIDELVTIGAITSAYGIKGWVKVKPFTQPIDNFLNYQQCVLKFSEKVRAVEILQAKVHGNMVIAQLDGVNDRDAAQLLAKTEIAVTKAELPSLEQDEFYWHELQDLQVYVENKLIGKVAYLLETGSNDVLVVQSCEGSIDDTERLLPYRPECILSVDLGEKRIEAEWDLDF